jgi:hypothetical protein
MNWVNLPPRIPDNPQDLRDIFPLTAEPSKDRPWIDVQPLVTGLGAIASGQRRHIRHNGYENIDQFYEFPELQKVPKTDSEKIHVQFAQAIKFRQGIDPGVADEAGFMKPGTSTDSLAVSTTTSLLKQLQTVISHNKMHRNISALSYREVADKVIRAVRDTESHRVRHLKDRGTAEKGYDDTKSWQAELHPQNIKALRKEIVRLATQEGGKKEATMLVMSAAGIFGIDPALTAAYLGISEGEWRQQLKGARHVVPLSIIDKLNFMIRLDVETADKPEVTFDGRLGDSALDLLKPDEPQTDGHDVGENFVNRRLASYKVKLEQRAPQLASSPSDKNFQRRPFRPRGVASTVETTVAAKPERPVDSQTKRLVKSVTRLALGLSPFDTMRRRVVFGVGHQDSGAESANDSSKSSSKKKPKSI